MARRTLFIFVVLICLVSCLASPMFGGKEEEPEEVEPAYEINPHFGFRRYFEMRYEPLSVPFPHQSYPQPPANPYY